MKKYTLLFFLVVFPLFASDEGFEEPWIPGPTGLEIDQPLESYPRNDYMSLIAKQSPVKRQRSRGTCTIFTTTNYLEYIFYNKEGFHPDLSEEWLEYLIMRNKQTEGSSITPNMKAIFAHGIASEKAWPYVGQNWLKEENQHLGKEKCSHLEEQITLWTSCLLGHRDPRLLDTSEHELLDSSSSLYDPEFIQIKSEANQRLENIRAYVRHKKSYKLKRVSEVKNYLSQGIPLIMGIKLYYGSWNHAKTDRFEIQPRDKSKWYQGVVGYPEPGSKDRRICDERGGGHSLIIVGYDDEKIIKTRMLMDNGEWKEFSYKGVYYFKNSWGTRGSGRDFLLEGKELPGYGMITQRYAHELGRWYLIPQK